MKKLLVLLFVISAMILSFAGNTLVIKGSNTILPIAQLWAEQLKKEQPSLNITIEGAGSSTGIAGLENGTADVANSSRWLKDSEIEKMHKANKFYMPVLIGYDGIALIVNKSLAIDNITAAQLKDIYTGKIKKWNEIDPKLPNNTIQAYSRNTASGTFEVFNEKILKNEKMVPTVKMLESTDREVDNISNNKNAIAYVGLGYVDDSVKVLKVNGVVPGKQTVLARKYLLARELFMYVDVTSGYPEKDETNIWLSFAFSKKGQDLVQRAGFIPAYGN